MTRVSAAAREVVRTCNERWEAMASGQCTDEHHRAADAAYQELELALSEEDSALEPPVDQRETAVYRAAVMVSNYVSGARSTIALEGATTHTSYVVRVWGAIADEVDAEIAAAQVH